MRLAARGLSARSLGRIRLTAIVTALVMGAWLTSVAAPQPNGATVRRTITPADGESLPSALARGGVRGRDAAFAAQAAAPFLASRRLLRGVPIRLALARDHGGALRLVAVDGVWPDGAALALARGFDGLFRARTSAPMAHEVVTVAEGRLAGSADDDADRFRADPELVHQAAKLLGDHFASAASGAGDRVRLVFTRLAAADGSTVETGRLLYAAYESARRDDGLYAFSRDGETRFFEAGAGAAGASALDAPIAGARISSPFGMRLHPILGVERMHEGVDFAAPLGTPVSAAAAGSIVEARAAEGYGNWLRIRHEGGLETDYGHLARFAPGVVAGAHVARGQIVGWVGRSGLATGPHLHYELRLNGAPIDPAKAAEVAPPTLTAAERTAFAAQRASVDGLIATAEHAGSPPGAGAPPPELRLRRL